MVDRPADIISKKLSQAAKRKRRKQESVDERGRRYKAGVEDGTSQKANQAGSSTLSTAERQCCLPAYDDTLDRIPINTLTQRRYNLLLTLFDTPGKQTQQRLAATVKYIESFREDLIAAARSEKNRSLYIRPPRERKLAGQNIPFHIQVNLDPQDNPRIYFMPKATELGKGSKKKVRIAIDYSNAAQVASATMTAEDPAQMKGVLQEGVILREILKIQHLRFDFCGYNLNKAGGMQKLKAKFIIPLANRGSLEKVLTPEGREKLESLSHEQKKQLFDKTLCFIKSVHDAGYVVSDIKPDNLLYHIEPCGEVSVLITDYGTSFKEDDPEACKTEGSPTYVAPEQIRAASDDTLKEQVGKPIDIFSLGKTLWEIFVGGQPPWMLETPCWFMGVYDPDKYEEVWTRHDNEMDFPEGSLEHLVLQMMHPDPSSRPTIDEIIEKKPEPEIGSPNMNGIRLLTPKESAMRLEKIRLDKENYHQKEVYTLRVSDRSPKSSQHFILEKCASSGPDLIQVPFKVQDDGCLETNGKNYDTLAAYLQSAGLKYNANFYFHF